MPVKNDDSTVARIYRKTQTRFDPIRLKLKDPSLSVAHIIHEAVAMYERSLSGKVKR